MNRLNTVALLVGLLLAVATATGVYVVLRSARGGTGAAADGQVTVLVAAADIAPGTVLDATNSATLLKFEPQPAAKVPADAVGSLNAVQGQTTLVSIHAGERLSSRLLASPGASSISAVIPPGMVAVLLPANEQTSLGGLVRAGDRIDLIASLAPRQGDSNPQTVTQSVLRDVRVLATGGDATAGAAATAAGNLTLAVDPADAVLVQHLLAANVRLAVALHRRDDLPGPDTRPVTADDLARRLSGGSGQ